MRNKLFKISVIALLIANLAFEAASIYEERKTREIVIPNASVSNQTCYITKVDNNTRNIHQICIVHEDKTD